MIFIIILFLVAIEAVVVGVSSAFLTAIVLLVFMGVCIFVNRNHKYKKSLVVYSKMIALNLAYAILCYIYMTSHNYSFLFALDTSKAFLPTTMDLLGSGDSYIQVLGKIWNNYDFFSRFQSGYYTFLTFFAYLAQLFDADVYFIIQVGNLSITSFSAVFIYKILKINELDDSSAVRYAILISTLSVLFIYNTVILRDGLVALFYIYIVYVVMSGFSIKNILKIIVAAYVMTTLRIESGLSCLLFVPFLFIIHQTKKNYFAISILFFVMMVLVYFLFTQYSSSVFGVYDNYYEAYAEGVDLQSGLIGHLQRIPIIGQFLSIIFTLLMPIPCWLKLSTAFYHVDMPEAYNIMNFPLSISAFFHAYILVYIIRVVVIRFKEIREYKYKWLFVPALVLLLLQSSVVESRRVMGVYVVFFVFWAISHNKATEIDKKTARLTSIGVFMLLQLIAIIKSVL